MNEDYITLKCTKCHKAETVGYILKLEEQTSNNSSRIFYMKVTEKCEIGHIGRISLSNFFIKREEINTLKGKIVVNWLQTETEENQNNLISETETTSLKEITKSKKNTGKLGKFISNNVLLIILGVIISYLIIPKIVDRLTPVNILAQKIRDRSKYKFTGAVCSDKWISHSQGRGTCSYHQGVDFYFDKGSYSKSIEQSIQEAKFISWVE